MAHQHHGSENPVRHICEDAMSRLEAGGPSADVGATLLGANIRAAAELALPLPARGERSEFALSSHKFRVTGPLRESQLGARSFCPPRVRPCGGAPSARPSPRKRGEGAEAQAALKLAPMGAPVAAASMTYRVRRQTGDHKGRPCVRHLSSVVRSLSSFTW